MGDAVDTVLNDLADSVTPDDAEREAMWRAVSSLTEQIEAVIDELGLTAETLHVGSTARGTWLSGERDIDLFVRFQDGTDRETLTADGLEIGRAVLEDGRADYAEHPYITGTYDGFAVDVVPCVDVADAALAETAVDRTPFHNAYVAEHLDDSLTADVRIAKRLLTDISAYGSDLRTRGFGGYLLELLIIEYGGIRALLDEIADWRPPVHLDPEMHGAREFDHPLVVIDPTDPHRNVAAVTDERQLSRLQHYTRRFLAEPSRDTFTLPERPPLDEADLVTELEDRGTEAVALVFDRPDLLEDQLWPQLRKTRSGIRDELDRRGFDVVRTGIFESENRLAILLECAVSRLPKIERHDGPPVAIREHAERFVETYATDSAVYGPFIDGDRYVIERERKVRSPRAFLMSEHLFDVRIGDQLEPVLESGYDVHDGDEIPALLPEFDTQLAAYFEPVP